MARKPKHTSKTTPKRRNPHASALAGAQFQPKVKPSAKAYDRTKARRQPSDEDADEK